jgi:hypothetical protein
MELKLISKAHQEDWKEGAYKLAYFFFFGLEFELRAYTLSHSVSPFL